MRRAVTSGLLLLFGGLFLSTPARAVDGEAEAGRLNEEGIAAVKAGDYPLAIERFTKARSYRPLDLVLRKNLAVAYSKHGAALLAAGKGEEAVREMRHAAALEPGEALHHANLGMALARTGEFGDARKSLETAIRVDPKCVPALIEFGTIAYREGELSRAIDAWRKAVAAGAGDRDDLVRALDRAQREYEIERNHRTTASAHFTISWDGEKDAQVGDRVVRILEDAWERIGADLGIRPEGPIRVILYTGREFQAVTGAHEWVGGLFDGRIRIPVKDFGRAEREIRDVIFHEYVHVAVAHIFESCPAWLNEGLAQMYEGRRAGAVRPALAAAKKAGRLHSLEDLRASFTRFPEADRARLAYVQALAFTDHLLAEHGPAPVGRFLEAIGEGRPEDEAATAAFGRPIPAIHESWLETL